MASEHSKAASGRRAGSSPWWQSGISLAVALLGILVVYRETFFAMATIWVRSETFTHGLVVPPIALWLMWRQRSDLTRLAPESTLIVLPVIVLVGLGWLVGQLATINALAQFAAVALLVAVTVCVLGLAVSRAIAFPLGFLFFAVPVGEFLIPQFMEWTANFTVFALRLSGVPVYREGLNFVIPSGSWSVVEACSGIRYLIASLMVGSLFAYLNYQSLKKRLIFVAVSALVPIVANWLRAYMIVMLGHLSGNSLAAGVDHLIYGWVFFGVVIVLMFMIGARWSDEPTVATGWPGEVAAHARSFHRKLPVVILAIVLGGLPALVAERLEARNGAAPADRAALLVPPQGGKWDLQMPQSDFLPAFENPAVQANQVYGSAGRMVGLYVGYYRNQTPEQKLVSSQNVVVRSANQNWSITEAGSTRVDLGGTALTAKAYRISGKAMTSRDRLRLRVWQWYWINGYLTASDVEAKIYTAWSRLRGGVDDSAVIVLYAEEGVAADVDARLAEFVADNWGAIEGALVRVRDTR